MLKYIFRIGKQIQQFLSLFEHDEEFGTILIYTVFSLYMSKLISQKLQYQIFLGHRKARRKCN